MVIVPVANIDKFLDLKYSDIEPNKVEIAKEISFKVDSSASPFFVKINPLKKIQKIIVRGNIQIEKPISDFEKDSYFQVGIIYAGDYKPGGFLRTFLPEWLNIVLSLSPKSGVGDIDFYDVSPKGKKINKKDSIKSLEMRLKTVATINGADGSFQIEINPKDTEVLGLWLRSDGDDSKAKFKTTIKLMEIN